MQHLVRQNYLQAEVQTATPQKSQLLLVEAAIKNIHRAKKAWKEERFEAGFDSLSLAQDIVTEILASLDKEGNPDLAGKIASIYVFIFRCLSEGGMTQDQQKLDDALRVLNAERETWRQVCEKFGTTVNNEKRESAAAPPAAPSKSPGIATATFGKPGTRTLEPPKTAGGGMSWDV